MRKYLLLLVALALVGCCAYIYLAYRPATEAKARGHGWVWCESCGSVRVWERPGPDRGRAVGSFAHGTYVDVLDWTWVEKETRFYYKISNGVITGYVPGSLFKVRE